eukprot:358219-Chlamydomonas_euryale.AAC.2
MSTVRMGYYSSQLPALALSINAAVFVSLFSLLWVMYDLNGEGLWGLRGNWMVQVGESCCVSRTTWMVRGWRDGAGGEKVQADGCAGSCCGFLLADWQKWGWGRVGAPSLAACSEKARLPPQRHRRHPGAPRQLPAMAAMSCCAEPCGDGAHCEQRAGARQGRAAGWCWPGARQGRAAADGLQRGVGQERGRDGLQGGVGQEHGRDGLQGGVGQERGRDGLQRDVGQERGRDGLQR